MNPPTSDGATKFLDDLRRVYACISAPPFEFDHRGLDALFRKMRNHCKISLKERIEELSEQDPDNPCFGHVSLFGSMDLGRWETAHTNFLAWLFDPNQPHGFGSSIIAAVLNGLDDDNADFNQEGIRVINSCSEHYVSDAETSGRIDVWVEGRIAVSKIPWLLVIEAKIEASLGDGQLKKYDSRITQWKTGKPNARVFKLLLTHDLNSDDYADRSGWKIWDYQKLVSIIWSSGRHHVDAPGYHLLRYYLTGVLSDVIGWKLPLTQDTEDPYNALIYSSALMGERGHK
ncbi:PD-(D/E)XK nuclease family protein [uncultured Thiodictyon sp.]|uniref:PD-(D/E)XK nuclease family protein n=1 Tax=uncultured Thiodictyon sp. TaxID=1846217 RepID=UPI0025E324B2|nr:PD-(D/E)XK nuclease family protein [uncultured Thiodictyon sp.]